MLCSMSLKNEVFTATIDPTIRSDTKELMISCGDDKLVPPPFPPPRAAEGGVGGRRQMPAALSGNGEGGEAVVKR
jgi:hypothetical protein